VISPVALFLVAFNMIDNNFYSHDPLEPRRDFYQKKNRPGYLTHLSTRFECFSATACFQVSIAMTASGSCFLNGSYKWQYSISSSSTEIFSAPGRGDSPPISIISAPSASISRARSIALCSSFIVKPSVRKGVRCTIKDGLQSGFA